MDRKITMIDLSTYQYGVIFFRIIPKWGVVTNLPIYQYTDGGCLPLCQFTGVRVHRWWMLAPMPVYWCRVPMIDLPYVGFTGVGFFDDEYLPLCQFTGVEVPISWMLDTPMLDACPMPGYWCRVPAALNVGYADGACLPYASFTGVGVPMMDACPMPVYGCGNFRFTNIPIYRFRMLAPRPGFHM